MWIRKNFDYFKNPSGIDPAQPRGRYTPTERHEPMTAIAAAGLGLSAYDLFTADTPEEKTKGAIGAASSGLMLGGEMAAAGTLGSGTLATALGAWGGPVGLAAGIGLSLYDFMN